MVNPASIGREFRFNIEDIEDIDDLAKTVNPLDAATEAQNRIHAVTENWCARAAAKGEGYRLFRSRARYEYDAAGYRAVFDFQILAPGEGAPATGDVFGPWPGHRIE
jgi:hypothetical protein